MVGVGHRLAGCGGPAPGCVALFHSTFHRHRRRVARTAGTVGDWRHGTLRYNGDDLQFYKLRSLSPSADRVFARTRATFNGHRRPQEDDLKLLEEDSIIVQVSVGGSEFEFALDSRGAMALIAWIEAAPSSRHERADHNRLLDKITRNRERR